MIEVSFSWLFVVFMFCLLLHPLARGLPLGADPDLPEIDALRPAVGRHAGVEVEGFGGDEAALKVVDPFPLIYTYFLVEYS